MICGPIVRRDDFDIKTHYRVVLDEEVRQYAALTDALFELIASWPLAKKQLFLKFVTGVYQLPAAGSEDLVIELPFVAYDLDGHRDMCRKLPQSHTCTNTLSLPNYLDSLQEIARSGSGDFPLSAVPRKLKELLDLKLTMAIENTIGYGLDAVNMKEVDQEALGGGFGGRSSNAAAAAAVFAPATKTTTTTTSIASPSSTPVIAITSTPPLLAQPTPKTFRKAAAENNLFNDFNLSNSSKSNKSSPETKGARPGHVSTQSWVHNRLPDTDIVRIVSPGGIQVDSKFDLVEKFRTQTPSAQVALTSLTLKVQQQQQQQQKQQKQPVEEAELEVWDFDREMDDEDSNGTASKNAAADSTDAADDAALDALIDGFLSD
jgi:hypothetical protein